MVCGLTVSTSSLYALGELSGKNYLQWIFFEAGDSLIPTVLCGKEQDLIDIYFFHVNFLMPSGNNALTLDSWETISNETTQTYPAPSCKMKQLSPNIQPSGAALICC